MITTTLTRGRLAVVVAVATIAIGATAAIASSPGGQAAPSISSADAIAAVQSYAPAATSLSAASAMAARGPYFVVEGTGVAANVDALDGTVRTLTLADRVPTDTTNLLSSSTALATATAFAAAHGLDTTGLSPEVALVDRGSTIEYRVDFRLRINGALVPRAITISINPATGAVFALTNLAHPYVTPPAPHINAAAAVAAARSIVGDPTAAVESTDLLISFDASGAQALVWHVALSSVGANGAVTLIEVDALTGSSTVIGRG